MPDVSATPDPATAPIRFGVLHDGGELESWQIRCLQQLDALPNVEAVVRLVPPLAADEIERLRMLQLDFLMCFAESKLPAALLDLPRQGVWRYAWGDWVDYRGACPGFWEVYDGVPVSGALLVRVVADADTVVVLREGFLRTQSLSVRKNRQQLQSRFSCWPSDLCQAMRRGQAGVAVTSLACRGSRHARVGVRGAPSRRQRAVLAARILARAARVGLRSLFRHDQWNIGIIDRPIEALLSTSVPDDINWLPATPRAELRADPFGAVVEGRSILFCEYFSYRDNKGYIVAMEVAARGVAARGDTSLGDTSRGEAVRVRIGPEPAVHLSYPYLLTVDGKLVCMPESSAANEVALYEFERFPDRCTRRATLIAGRGLADATVFAFQNRWWLAASDVADKGANSELHLWFADAPTGPWHAHPGNPVKIDVRSARPAGTPFVVDGVLYRPAQDCSSTYGARVVINRVLTLTPTEFREDTAATVNPDRRGPYPQGLHTVSAFDGRTLIDGKRSVFVPAEFFRVLRHYLT